jgi:hypothetical protein
MEVTCPCEMLVDFQWTTQCYIPATCFHSVGLFCDLKMEVTCPCEMLVDFQWTTQCYIPEDRAHHKHLLELPFLLNLQILVTSRLNSMNSGTSDSGMH